jgi:hypothetical protein
MGAQTATRHKGFPIFMDDLQWKQDIPRNGTFDKRFLA